MLVKSSLYAHKQQPARNSVVTYQGSAKYDHIKKAAESLMRQQHSDKTELEIVVSKVNVLEQEKRDLLEASTKLLETNVKQETSLKAERSQYSTLRFDVVACQTLSASVKDYVANLEKKMSTRAEDIRAYKLKFDQLQKGLELGERAVQHEKDINDELSSSVQKMKLEKEHLSTRAENEAKQNKELNMKVDSLQGEINVLNSKVRENALLMNEMAKHKDSLLGDTEILRAELAQAKQRHLEAEHTMSDLRAEKDCLQTRLPLLEAEVAQLNDKNKSIQDLAEQTNKAFADSQKQLEIKNNSLLETQAEVELKKLLISSLEEACERQKAELEKSQRLISEYLTTISTGATTNAELVQANTNLKSQLEERTTDVESLRRRVAEITESRDHHQKECVSLTGALSELREAHEKIATQLQSEIEVTKKISTDVVTGEKHAESLEKDLDNLRKESELVVKNLEQRHRDETSKLEAQRAAASAEWNAKETQLMRQIESATADVEVRLTKQQEGFENMKAGLLAEVRRVEEANNQEHKSNSDKIAALTRELDKYKGLYTEAQKAIDAAKAQLTPTTGHDEGKANKKKSAEAEEKAKEAGVDKPKPRSLEKQKEDKEEKSKDRSAERRKEEEKGDIQKERGRRAKTNTPQDFFVHANEVPTELEPEVENPTQDDGKKRRKLMPTKPIVSESSSPSKRVRFSEGTKKATYSKQPRQVASKSRKNIELDEDVFTFRG